MTHLIGRGRYARETYPLSPGAAGGSAADIVPLTRFRFIDGGTTQGGLNGSVADPYKTVSEFLSSVATSESVADASALVVGIVTPAEGGYVEPIAIPPYRNIELRGDQAALVGSESTVTGNLTWHNAAGSPGTNAPPSALLFLHNFSLQGNITITDDGSVPSELIITADEFFYAPSGAGSITATGATALAGVAIVGQTWQGSVNLGTSDTSAQFDAAIGGVTGNVIAKVITASGGNFGGNLTVGATDVSAVFDTSSFANAPVLTGPPGSFAQFDGVSWRNFLSAGGTVAAAGIIALVTGGYSAGAVQGANLTNANVSVALTGGGGATIAGGGNHYVLPTGTLTGTHTVTLLTAGAQNGDTILITRQDTTANTYSVLDDTGTSIAILPASSRGFVLARFNGTHWVMDMCGADVT